jgi:hypothetical protein
MIYYRHNLPVEVDQWDYYKPVKKVRAFRMERRFYWREVGSLQGARLFAKGGYLVAIGRDIIAMTKEQFEERYSKCAQDMPVVK